VVRKYGHIDLPAPDGAEAVSAGGRGVDIHCISRTFGAGRQWIINEDEKTSKGTTTTQPKMVI